MNKLTPGLLFLVCSAVFLRADDDPTALNNIIAAKTCDQVLVSPDKHWLAATRTYSEPDPGYLWKTNDDSSSLVIWAFDSDPYNNSGSINVSDYVRWNCPQTNMIVKIAWSPDSQFLVIATTNASGHEPWLFPTLLFCLKDNTIHTMNLSVVSTDFKFVGPHILQIKTGDPSTSQFTTLDMSAQSADLPVLVQLKPQKEPQ
jgi:DNA-binding beta-propeller fold protein YncE